MDDMQPEQAGRATSNSDFINNDETVNNESMVGEKIESADSDQTHVSFSTAHSNAVGKSSIAGPSANRNER